jgi:hypothetical protein
VRPGFIRFSERQYDPRIVFITTPELLKNLKNFALDTGGVLEYYPARPIVLRFDVGNTYVRDVSTSGLSFNHNQLQLSTGVGFRL